MRRKKTTAPAGALNYPSIANSGNPPLVAAYLESLHPRRAELFLFISGARNEGRPGRDQLARGCIEDGIAIDEQIDVNGWGIETVMLKRKQAHTTKVQAFEMPDVFITPISTDPADFKRFDYAGFLRQGGLPMRELWIGNRRADGAFDVGYDATAMKINGTGNPRQNPGQLTLYLSDVPGENGALLYADDFGFRAYSGIRGSHRYCRLPGSFVLYDPVANA